MSAFAKGRSGRRHAEMGLLATAVIAFAGPAYCLVDNWAALQRDYVAFTHLQDPLRAGGRGDRAALEVWPDDRPQSLATRAAALRRFKTRLARLGQARLSREDALSRAVMTRQVDLALESIDLDEARLAFQTGQGFFTVPDGQAEVTTLTDEADARAWLKRIGAIPAYFAAETANLQRGIDTGFTQPALVTQSAIAALNKAAALPTAQSPLLLPFATLPAAVSSELRVALEAEARRLIDAEVRPAQTRTATFLRDRYLPHSRPDLGVSSLPGGARYYAFVVRRETTTDLTPARIHNLGLAEVARIRAEMTVAMAELGFTGDPHAFSQALKADPSNFAPNAQVYAEKAGETAKRIDYLLPRYFGLLPRLTYGVRAKPAALESTSDGYLPGAAAAGQAGAVVYSAAAAPHEPLYNLPAWLAHEGVPGHHLQIALAQENGAIPEFRRNDDVTAFVEGWALYAERLGEEMGIYRTPQERFGRLSMEMWRACRLVMDTGLHAMGWTRARARACLEDNTALAESTIDYETDRYIGWPAQALGYKIGELRIEAMRRRAQAALGPRFDLRAFHDVVLSEGALPMDLLEARLDAWIAERRRPR